MTLYCDHIKMCTFIFVIACKGILNSTLYQTCHVCVVKSCCYGGDVFFLQVLYVPDPEYVSSAGSSPSLSPISPLSPTSSEAELEKVTYTLLHLLPK